MIVNMLAASPEMVFMDYWNFAKIHGPQLQFAEALMKARDDLDRDGVKEIMETLRRKVKEEDIGEPEEPTIMVSHGTLASLSFTYVMSRSKSKQLLEDCCQTSRILLEHMLATSPQPVSGSHRLTRASYPPRWTCLFTCYPFTILCFMLHYVVLYS